MKSVGKAKKSMNNQQGMSLIEVLVAILITTVGLLGFAGLQTRALTSTEDAYLRVQAMSLAQELVERARINSINGLAQSYAINNAIYTDPNNWAGSMSPPAKEAMFCNRNSVANLSPTDCNPVALAKADAYQIRARALRTLPEGSVWGETCANGRLCIFVSWGGLTAQACRNAYVASGSVSVPRDCVVVEGV